MARVIERRTPPYLLIVFVLLFVIATVLAVLFYTNFAKADKKRASLLAVRNQWKGDVDPNTDSEFAAMLREYEDSAKDKLPKSVVTQLRGQRSDLAQLITGLSGTPYMEAKLKADATLKALDASGKGLCDTLVWLHSTLGARDAEIARFKQETDKLKKDLQDRQKALDALRDDFKTKTEQKDQEVAQVTQKFQDYEKDQMGKLDQAKKDYENSVGDLRTTAGNLSTQLQAALAAARKWELKYKEVTKRGAGPTLDTEKPVRRPDGKVIKVAAEDNTVTVNIGSRNRVTEDLRLTVYPYTGIPDSGAGKAVIEVISVGDTVSQCRIIKQDKDNPIITGDLVANVVFDALRNYNFVVEGQFDLDNTGEPTVAGNKAAKDLIQRYGGRVQKDVDIDTDYVVLGDPPSRPKKPEDTDPQEIWDRYQTLLKAFSRYQDVKKQAEGMHIPVLGARRFLDLVGYVPSRPVTAQRP